MQRNTDSLIAALVQDMDPRPPMRRRTGLALAALAAAVPAAFVALVLGIRADVMAGEWHIIFLLGLGLNLLLAAASASAVVGMASPQVGNRHEGWRWAAAAGVLLPLAALLMLATRSVAPPAEWVSVHDTDCLVMGTALGVLMAITLTQWLRRGAPASPELAGLLTGVAAGSTGMAAFALHCGSDAIYHVGFWHIAPVLVSAVLGRAIVPRLVRW